jgi:hypothetical protein
MRDFQDEHGKVWTATVDRQGGMDYKGAFHLVMTPADGGAPVELTDIRWNTERTARRTLETMSVVELRRRLRSALGRASTA